MDELIKQVTDRVGIPADKAKLAVETVLSSVKSKLPGPIASQIDGAFSAGQSKFADVAKGLGDLIGISK